MCISRGGLLSKRLVLVDKSGLHRILGVTDAPVADVCTQGAFLQTDDLKASLVKVYPRYYLYRELNVPDALHAFNEGQR